MPGQAGPASPDRAQAHCAGHTRRTGILFCARPCCGLVDRLMRPMERLIDEFRQGWQGTSRPSPLFSMGFAASCIAVSTAARWCLSLIRPDVYFTPYFPAVLFATAFGGFRIGIATAVLGGLFGMILNS